MPGAAYKLHDFGFRGVSSVESAAMGGLGHGAQSPWLLTHLEPCWAMDWGHLVNFMGSDTVIALVAAEKLASQEPSSAFETPTFQDICKHIHNISQ